MASSYGGQARISAPIVKKTAVIWSGTSVTTLALAFRYYVRFKTFRHFLLDDFLTLFAWILMEVTAAVRMPSANFVANAERYFKGSLAVLFLFYVGLWTIKLSFLVFFYKLGEQVAYCRVRWWIVTTITVASGAICVGTIQYHCLAESLEKAAIKCLDRDAIEFQSITLKVNYALDVMTDALIMLLPISILWNVRISMTRRLALVGVFSLVIITMVIAIVRLTVTTDGNKISRSNNPVESTWLYTWHFIESSVGAMQAYTYFTAIIVACLASFRALFSNKKRAREAEEALERERDMNGRPGLNLRVIKAHAKHFQDSLFNTVKSENETRMACTTENPLRHNSSEGPTVSRVEEYRTDDVPVLNAHVLVTGPENTIG
ncbi:hypothetical protein K505DRAFT_367528 [Melanomma pulvis-pyrius CBS 109.77]|uniref:Rhodopsin domain-containing protein n=1 Tax=Melanomma pulvis-pyrius CBS 109.77 TaxID=1314802 RepID=A0A6A6WTJ9_9PLEO|nr:hypothetical protein K505DRAFT_367528 [Melanomma pulvis-pyrius CBS 109.77]